MTTSSVSIVLQAEDLALWIDVAMLIVTVLQISRAWPLSGVDSFVHASVFTFNLRTGKRARDAHNQRAPRSKARN